MEKRSDTADLAGMRDQVYEDPRPAAQFARFHERARTREPDWVYGVVRVLTTAFGKIAFRARAVGAERVPASGAVILAPNHFSYMDHFFVGMFTRRRVRFMAKSQLFRRPAQWIYTHGGVFPVRRGHRDEEALTTARTILFKGGCLVMYCEGGRSRTGKLAERAKPGIGRLALETGATVVPVGIFGSQGVRNWRRLRFPRVTVHYGEPLRFGSEPDASRERQQAVADEIFAHIREAYAALEAPGSKLREQESKGVLKSFAADRARPDA